MTICARGDGIPRKYISSCKLVQGREPLWTRREVHVYVRCKYHKIAKVDERVKDGHLLNAWKVGIVNKLYLADIRFSDVQFFTNNTETPIVTAFVWCFVGGVCYMM